MPSQKDPDDPESGGGRFAPTRWTLIDDLHNGNDQQRMEALEALCKMYRLPLYCAARRWGLNPQDSEDVLHDFLADVLRRGIFAKADITKGHLRTFLLSGLKQQIADWHRTEHAQKRGGGTIVLSWEQDAEKFYGCEPIDDQSPDKFFAQKCREAICDQVVKNMRKKRKTREQVAQFDALTAFLCEPLEDANTQRLAAEFGTSAGNIKVILSRLRKEFKNCVRKYVSEAVGDVNDVDDELRDLGFDC